jgi:hypothetical protein
MPKAGVSQFERDAESAMVEIEEVPIQILYGELP